MKTIITLVLTLFAPLIYAQESNNEILVKKALIVVTNHAQKGSTNEKTGYFLSEVTHVYYPLIEAGFTIDFASPKGGIAPLDPSSLNLKDSENKNFYENKKLMAQLDNTISLKDVDSKKYQVIHFAGGHGAMWDFPTSKDLQKVTREIYENGGIVAAVCHGPAALVNVKLSNGKYLIENKRVSGFTDAEEKAIKLEKVVPFLLESKMKEHKAIFKEGKMWSEQVSVDGRLVTGQNPKSAKKVGLEIVKLFNKK